MAINLWAGGTATKTRLLMTMISVAICWPASAQQRTPNNAAQGILRTWPGSADWQVALTRLVDGGLGCMLLTGHIDQAGGERYFWGIRMRDNNLAATIMDSNQQAVAGPSIQIIVDRVPVGTYQITRRLGPESGLQSVAAELPMPDNQKLLDLIGVGGTIQFITANSTYSAPLQGAQQSMQNYQACILEATHLTGGPWPR